METISNNHIDDLFPNHKVKWLYPIYVPTYTRAGVAPLLNLLSSAKSSVQSKVVAVVRKEERSAYKTAYPWLKTILVKRAGLGPARTRALMHAKKAGHTRIIMMDDDIKHVSLLERISREGKDNHTRRYSSRVSGIPEPDLMIGSLSVACKLVDSVFSLQPEAVYGAARNALFSGSVDTSVGATLNKGTFPASVMFYDVTRMENFELPKRFHMHGEDVAFAMDVMSREQLWFTLPGVAFDQDGNIKTTIPLDPTDSEARRVDIDNAAIEYPGIHPFLRESVKNKAGGVMRVGMNWRRWYTHTGTSPIEIPIEDLINQEKRTK